MRVSLNGRPSNPEAIGARIRVQYSHGCGPVQEVSGGGGYRSQNSSRLVVARDEAVGIAVRWPDGERVDYPLAKRGREVRISRTGDVKVFEEVRVPVSR